MNPAHDALVSDALAALGVERLVLAVHDASFPGLADEDIGRGSPYSGGAREFLAFARRLGFDGIQLGPQGKISLVNPSPYDGTVFAKSTLSVALGALARDPRWGGLLPEGTLRELLRTRPDGALERAALPYAFAAQGRALRAAYQTLTDRPEAFAALRAEQDAFWRHNQAWLAPDALFEALAELHGTDDWERWPRQGEGALDERLLAPGPGEEAACEARRLAVERERPAALGFHVFCQYLVHAQHDELRREARRLGLLLSGDLQIGIGKRDLWQLRRLFLPGYLMGAPPSRTNPDGQPWGYPVLDPRQYLQAGRTDGPALRFMRARLDKMLTELDGVRLDHPHGLVCPWVYRAADPDPLHAVQTGARLFSSPDLPDHPELAAFALVGPEALATSRPRYADDWVRALTPVQVDAYAVLLDVIVATARAHGRDEADIASEVLSTCPFPLAAVLARHGLGRFRVTQKANPADERDPYRTALAAPADWVMLGTHDTPPIWRVMNEWGAALVSSWAEYLATRLCPEPSGRPAFAARLTADRAALAHALFADLFVGPARRISIFFPDLFGMTEIYNRPGVVHPENWTLRVPPDYARSYAARCAAGTALDLRRALALALRARFPGSPQRLELAQALERAAA